MYVYVYEPDYLLTYKYLSKIARVTCFSKGSRPFRFNYVGPLRSSCTEYENFPFKNLTFSLCLIPKVWFLN